jgi:hypothetical protein
LAVGAWLDDGQGYREGILSNHQGEISQVFQEAHWRQQVAESARRTLDIIEHYIFSVFIFLFRFHRVSFSFQRRVVPVRGLCRSDYLLWPLVSCTVPPYRRLKTKASGLAASYKYTYPERYSRSASNQSLDYAPQFPPRLILPAFSQPRTWARWVAFRLGE